MANLDRLPSNFHRPKLPTLSARSLLPRSDRFSHQRPRNKRVRVAARLMIELGSELERARWSFRNYPLRLGIRQLITSIVSVFLTMQLSILIALPSLPQCPLPLPPLPHDEEEESICSRRPQIRDKPRIDWRFLKERHRGPVWMLRSIMRSSRRTGDGVEN